MKCIICGGQCEPSVEHIIGKSLGNKNLHISDVCEKCNNQLGTKIDAYLSEHILIKMMRESEGVLNKSGNSIHAFSERYRSDDGDLYCFKDGTPKLVPVPKDTDKGFCIKVSSPDIEKGLKIAAQKLNRMKKVDGTSYTPKEKEQIIQNAHIGTLQEKEISFSVPADIDKTRYALAFIKIAYEYAYKALGNDYLNDPKAKQLQRFLHVAIQQERHKISQIIKWNAIRHNIRLFENNCIEEILLRYEQYFSSPIRHSILLAQIAEGKVICQISLFRKVISSATVLISENARLLKRLQNNTVYIAFVFNDGSTFDISDFDDKE